MNKKIFATLILGIFLLSFASAVLDTKTFDKDKPKYGEISIKDWLGISNKADYRLMDYEDSVINVWAEGEYKLYKKTHLFTGVFYKDTFERKGVLKDVKFFIWKYENTTHYNPIYEENCYLDYSNSTEGNNICENIVVDQEEIIKDTSHWIEYVKGMDLDESEGRWRMEAKRPKNKPVDFILEAHGKEFEEWAWFNNSWQYKREISSLSGTISALYNITYDSDMNADFSDLRFLDKATETTELNYTIISKVDSIEALIRVNNNNQTEIIMYYGNAGASTTKSFDNLYYSPVLGYTFDNGTTNDYTTNGNDGTINGATFVNTGYIDGAYSYDGSNDYVNTNYVLSEANGGVSFWYKGSAITGNRVMASFASSLQDGQFEMNIIAGGLLTVSIYSGGVKSVTTSSAINDDVWHNIVLTWVSGGNMEVFMDGSSQGTTSIGALTPGNSQSVWLMATPRNPGSYETPGIMDEVLFYDFTLTSTQAKIIAGQNLPSFVVWAEQSSMGTSVILNYPQNNEEVSEEAESILVTFNYTAKAIGENLTNATLYLWNVSSGNLLLTNFTNLIANNTNETIIINYNNLSQGVYKWNSEVCAIIGGCSFNGINNTFIVHTGIPLIIINYPIENPTYIIIGQNETLNYSIQEEGVNVSTHFEECWFEYNSTEVLNNISYSPLPHSWEFETNFVNVTAINIRQGSGNSIIENIPELCTRAGNLTIEAEGFIVPTKTDFYCFDRSDNKVFIDTIYNSETILEINITAMEKRSLNCTENSTSFKYVLDKNSLCVHTIDEYGLHNQNITDWEYKVIELNSSFNNETSEGSSEDFEVSLKIGSGLSLSGAIFHYGNLTEFPSISSVEGNYALFLNNYMIPNVDGNQNVTWFFEVALDDSTEINTSSLIQYVKSIEIDDCSNYSNLIYRLELYDEETYNNLTGELDIILEIIPMGNGVVLADYSNEFNSVQFKNICASVNLSDSTLLLNSILRYGAGNYTKEFYHIQKASLTDYPTTIKLYDIPLNKSTEFKLIYQNENLVKVSGAVVQLLRQRFDNGNFILVEAPLTSIESTALVHINVESNKYGINVVKDGVLLDSFSDIVFKCENELTGECSFDLFQSVEAPNLVAVETLRDFSYSIQSDNDSITIPFSIPSGTPNNIRVELRQKKITGTDLNCNTSVYSSSGSITCGFNESIDESTLELKIFKANELQAQRGFIVREDLASDFGKNNLFIVLVLLFSLVGMFISSPEWQIIISVITLVLAGSLWLLNGMNLVVGLGGLAWLIVISVILIKEISKQEDR